MARAPQNKRLPIYVPTDGVQPICPHCEHPLEGVYRQDMAESLGKAHLWFCLVCRKVLGVSHRKGFWMG
ncbi:MAG: hypothetical protein S0880_26350 [Actinomycetota bacterium]|nr:hypothetical protein [Actinomycetota bacterium]